jgi:hypothetical protein
MRTERGVARKVQYIQSDPGVTASIAISHCHAQIWSADRVKTLSLARDVLYGVAGTDVRKESGWGSSTEVYLPY